MRAVRPALAALGRSLPLVSLMFAAASLSRAGDITYYVYQTIGAGSVSGDIVTDGNTGTLNQADIVGYDLVLNDAADIPFCVFGECALPPFYMDSSGGYLNVGLDGSDLTATPAQLSFNFSGTDGGLFAVLHPSGDFGVIFATGPGGFFSVLPPGAGEALGGPYLSPTQFSSLSGTQVIGTTGVTLSPPPGGSSSAPALLLRAQPIGEVSSSIGGFGSQDYYRFLWAGGAFSATAAITGANAAASYLFSEGTIGGCSSGGSATLNSGDNFTSSIEIANLPAGQYCIGVDANSATDPPLSLTFNTPVSGFQTTPEPAGFALVSTGLGLLAALRLRTIRRRPPTEPRP